jgi:hypothetical protein
MMELSEQSLRRKGESTSGDAGGNCGHASLVPPDPGVDQRASGVLEARAQIFRLLIVQTVRDKIKQREAENDDEIRSHGVASLPDDFERQPGSILQAAPVLVSAVVCEW